VERFPAFHPQASWWKRLLLGFEEHIVPDAAGRVLLSSGLRMHGKLEREAMLLGQGHYLELWDAGVWHASKAAALSNASTPPPGMEDFSL
jgi:MraZ protein